MNKMRDKKIILSCWMSLTMSACNLIPCVSILCAIKHGICEKRNEKI